MATNKLLATPELGWKRYDDMDNLFEYTYLEPKEREYGFQKTVHFSNKIGASVKFNIISDKIRVIAPLWYDGSNKITVKLDGDYMGQYSCYAANNENYVNVFEKTDLAMCEHYLELINEQSSYFYFDAIDISENGTLKAYNQVLYKLLIKQNNQLYTIKPDFYANGQYNCLGTSVNIISPECDNYMEASIKNYIKQTTISDDIFRPIDKFDRFNLVIKRK